MKPQSKRISMQDIADRLQISKNAVSLALNGKAGVSDETRNLVITLAQKLNYNNMGVELHPPSSSKNILVFIPDYIRDDAFFYNDIYWAIEQRASQKGYNAVMAVITNEMQETQTLPPVYSEMDFSGFLLIGVLKESYVRYLLGLPLTILSVDHSYYGIDIPAVGTANLAGSYRITQKVVGYNHTEIGFVGSSDMTSSIYERWCGFQRALTEAKLPIHPEYNINDDSPLGVLLSDPVDILQRLRQFPKMPTAFVCGGDRIAIAVTDALKQLGYLVPQQISVVGFDDIELGNYVEPKLTTMHVKRKEMGILAVDLLLKACAGKRIASLSFLEPEYICRNSLAWAPTTQQTP